MSRPYARDESPTDITDLGRWVTRGLIVVWEAVEAEPTTHPVACPTCGALSVERCKSSTGRLRGEPHRGRTIPLACQCGAPRPSNKSPYCNDCRAEAKRATWRKIAARQSAQRRVA